MMAGSNMSGPGWSLIEEQSTIVYLLPATAKRDEIARLMGILELDFEEKNVLPPREVLHAAKYLGLTSLIPYG